MGDLLDFRPPDTLETISTSKMIDEDIWFSCTPDMPELRYSKEILVFIWDEVKIFKNLKELGFKPTEDYTILNYDVKTKRVFKPFMNVEGGVGQGFKQKYVLPYKTDWDKNLDESDKKSLGEEPKVLPIRGQLLSVSLSMLQALDLHYNNMNLHTRVPLDLEHTTIGQKYKAFGYLCLVHKLLKYQPHEKTNKFVQGVRPKVIDGYATKAKQDPHYRTACA